MIGLRNPERYCSLSAFAPIIAPSQVPWGQKAFTAYLGDDKAKWLQYDTVELLGNAVTTPPICVDVGTADPFYHEQLKPELLAKISEQKQFDCTLHLRDGYDHSYYFVSSFIGEHIAFHARHLKHA